DGQCRLVDDEFSWPQTLTDRARGGVDCPKIWLMLGRGDNRHDHHDHVRLPGRARGVGVGAQRAIGDRCRHLLLQPWLLMHVALPGVNTFDDLWVDIAAYHCAAMANVLSRKRQTDFP